MMYNQELQVLYESIGDGPFSEQEILADIKAINSTAKVEYQSILKPKRKKTQLELYNESIGLVAGVPASPPGV